MRSTHNLVGRLGGLLIVALMAGACGVSIDLGTPGSETLPGSPGNETGALTASDGNGVVIEGRYTWKDSPCQFDEPADVSTRCGWLQVPERWDDPAAVKTIRLQVAIFSAGPTDVAPVVYLEGGPGGDALANIGQSFDTLFGALVDTHEIVIIGQRGTGSADPHLRCDNVLELSRDLLDEVSPLEDELGQFEAAYVDCANDFAERRIDTSAYNSVQNAHDVEALRLALGHDQWNVIGISYGTRLGQTLMRLHPEGIRAIILDSVVPTERDPNVDLPVTAKRAFETLWAGCATSADCSGTFGDLEARFFALVDELNQRPLEFEVGDLFTGETFTAVLDGAGLVDQVFSALYAEFAFVAVPELVTQLEEGNTTGIAAMVSQSVTSEPFFADGMFWSVMCTEEVPFITQSSRDAGLTGDPRYDQLRPDEYADFLDTVCGAFDPDAAAAVEDELVSSDLPVLVMAGSYDPITPPSGGREILAGLSNGFFFEYPHTGHGALSDPCAQAMALEFFAEPSASPDDACIDEIEEPDWTPEIFEGIAFEPFSYDAGIVSASGLAPVGWDDFGEGTYANTDNLLHSSVVVQQVFGDIPTQALLSSVEDFLGAELVELDGLDVGGRAWSRREGQAFGSVFDVLIATEDGATFFVLFENSPSDRDRAVAALLDPILSAIGRP